MKPKTTKKWLRKEFEETEILNFSRELASKLRDRDQLTLDKKAVVKHMDERMAAADAKIGVLQRYINDGFTMEDIDCEIMYDYEAGEKCIVRTDTGEIVERQALTDEERQLGIDEAEAAGIAEGEPNGAPEPPEGCNGHFDELQEWCKECTLNAEDRPCIDVEIVTGGSQ